MGRSLPALSVPCRRRAARLGCTHLGAQAAPPAPPLPSANAYPGMFASCRGDQASAQGYFQGCGQLWARELSRGKRTLRSLLLSSGQTTDTSEVWLGKPPAQREARELVCTGAAQAALLVLLLGFRAVAGGMYQTPLSVGIQLGFPVEVADSLQSSWSGNSGRRTCAGRILHISPCCSLVLELVCVCLPKPSRSALG